MDPFILTDHIRIQQSAMNYIDLPSPFVMKKYCLADTLYLLCNATSLFLHPVIFFSKRRKKKRHSPKSRPSKMKSSAHSICTYKCNEIGRVKK